MRILIVTDLEGVAGIVDKDNWTQRHSKYYEKATRLLTKEANAAVQGFFDGGADDVPAERRRHPAADDRQHSQCLGGAATPGVLPAEGR